MMKILLINNYTVHLTSLAKSLAGHEVEVQTYHPGLKFNDDGKDLVILSGGGGEGLEIHDYHHTGELWHQNEMDFIRRTDKNILGICMGFEVIARAYGAPITPVGRLILDREELQLTKAAQAELGTRKVIQYEAHSWRVQDVPSHFNVKATSKSGVELFDFIDQDNGKQVIASQFHPEKGGVLELKDILLQFA
jgi:anthranilate/para-aminobenzoate synthase component II